MIGSRKSARKKAGEYPVVWDGQYRPSGRRGQRCKVVERGATADTARIEFTDGARFIVARRNLRKAR